MEADAPLQRNAARPDILVVSINYAPEPTGFAPHVTAFCDHLSGEGHRVTVLTGFPFAPNWARWPNYAGRFWATETQSGVRIIRQTHFIPRRPRRMIERLLMEGSFCLVSALSLLWFNPPVDLVIYVGAQPSIAMFARLTAWLKRVPYGLMINDLASGAAVNVGIVKSPWLLRGLHAFEYFSYRAAAGAVVLCQGFKDALMAEGFPAHRIFIVRSPVDVERVRPVDSDRGFRTRHRLLDTDFVVLFAGSMGLKQGMENMVAAALRLRADFPEIKWLLVGDGETRSATERLVRTHLLEHHVRFIPFQPFEEMSAMFAAADLLLLNQLAAVKDTVVPSKLLTYMSAGRPVLAAVNEASQGAEILRESRGGRIVAPEDPQALASAVCGMKAAPEELAKMGRANRAYALENFDQQKIMRALENFVQKIATECRNREWRAL